MMKGILNLFLILFLPQLVWTQSSKTDLLIGDKLFELGDYYGASLQYKKVYEVDSSLKVTFKYAQALRLYNSYEHAYSLYEKVNQEDDKSQYTESLYWMASLEKNMEQYADAAKHFKAFTKVYPYKTEYIYYKARQEVKSVKFIERLLLDTAEVYIQNLGIQVNSPSAEFASVLLNDSTMYYSSLRAEKISDEGVIEDKKYAIKIYEANLKDSVWKDNGPVAGLDARNHFANGTFNHDQSIFYYSDCNNSHVCKIYQTKWDGEKWTEASPLNSLINVPGFSSTQPMYAKINKVEVLYFSSTQPKGKGKMDIWYSIMKAGEFSAPRNLGSKVNSKGDEIAPYFDPTSNKFYFSSDWHYGLGGFDNFYSDATTYKSLGKPVNLGIPLNSSVNDMYFHPDSKGNGYFTSVRPGSVSNKKDAICCNDIFRFEYPIKEEKEDTLIEVEPELVIENILKEVPVVLYFHNDCPNPRTRDTLTQLNYLETYNAYKELVPTYQKEVSKGLENEDSEDAVEEIDDFFEAYVDKGLEDLKVFSDLLLEQLDKGYSIELSVKGYASPLAKSDYNVNLTLRRISSMENYLREHQKGVYNKYLDGTSENGAILKIKKIPFGEYKSDALVSDNYYDQQKSVYSKGASLERKIEVISLKRILQEEEGTDTLSMSPTFLIEPGKINKPFVINLGKVSRKDSVITILPLDVQTDIDWNINAVEGECHCTNVVFDKNQQHNKTEGTIKVRIDVSQESGEIYKRIFIKTSAGEDPLMVVFEMEVVD